MPRAIFLVLVLATIVTAMAPMAGLSAQDDGPCNGDLSHQFDYWIGDWTVYSGEDVAGESSVRPILDGCVLHENWSGAQGSKGSSFNFYNPQTKRWQQFWVWRNGTTLELEGGYKDGKMVLEGQSLSQTGEEIFNRITFYDNEDGTVRQHWQYSKDDGETFEEAFDGLYKKK